MTADPTQEEGADTGQQPTQPTGPVPKPVTPDSTEGIKPQPTAVPPNLEADTMAPTPATTEVAGPPGFPQQPVAPNPSLAPVVPPSIVPDEGDL